MKKRFYLAYGSNLNVWQMLTRCPDAEAIGITEIPGYELLFKGSLTGSYLTIEKNPKGKVPAAVWATTARDEAALDYYEGCPTFYYKKEMELPVTNLNTKKTTRMKVYVYIMHEERKVGIPTKTYLETCLEGYEDFGLPQKYLFEAVERTRRLCHEGRNEYRTSRLPKVRKLL